MPTTKPLSETGRHLLETAGDRPTHSLLPLPPNLSARGAVRQRLLAGLLAAGLVEEVPAADRASAWRTDETGRGIGLRVTPQGLAAIGRTPPVTRRVARVRRPAIPTASEAPATATPPWAGAEVAGSGEAAGPVPSDAPLAGGPGGKLGRVLASIATEAGATLPELVTLTGWQPHTTRAALTRLRQRGYALERLALNGRMVYRLGAVG